MASLSEKLGGGDLKGPLARNGILIAFVVFMIIFGIGSDKFLTIGNL